MTEAERLEAKTRVCLDLHNYFESMQTFLRLAAQSVSQMRLRAALEHLDICNQTIKPFKTRLKENINDL